MRILYFYSEDIRNRHKPDFVHQEVLHGLGLNFEAEWRFEVERKREGEYVCYVEHCKPLPDFIFSYTENNVNISAIVGANGSGKTSFARMMHRLSLDPKGIRMLLVAEIDGKFHVWGNSISVEFVNRNNDRVGSDCIQCLNRNVAKGLSYRGIEEVFKFVYYSPSYTSQHVLDTAKREDFNGDDNFFYDLSTTGLLKHAKGGWQGFEKRDYWDFWRFISGASLMLKPDQAEIESILFVRGVRVEIDWQTLEEAETYFKEPFVLPEAPIGRDAKRKALFLSRLPSVINAFKRCRLMTAHVVYACAICSWYGREIRKSEEKLSSRDYRLLDFLEAAKEVSVRNTEMAESAVGKEFDKFWQALKRNPRTRGESAWWCGLYDAIRPEDGPRYSSRTGMCYSFKKFAEDSVLSTIVDCHDKLSQGVDFLRIETRPRISSGEWAIISIMSRIYSLRDYIPDGGNVVLFLDEAETSLHPNWQRSIVSTIIRFCEMAFTYAKFHVIFATHSPIILSDIPSSNVVFLRKKIGEKTVHVYEEDETCVVKASKNTFGANIYDLFQDSFFLEDGPVGQLARTRIGEVLEEVSRRLSSHNADDTTHPYRKGLKLGRWLDILGDKLLVKYIAKLKDAGIISLSDE